ncbi:MAG: right-handed parallel beta-helix repeat-containing protein [Planctomycetales bacterium]|nr:right-handed parallel beta-helix repeat-containing protein [Planctomycetales bacterium]
MKIEQMTPMANFTQLVTVRVLSVMYLMWGLQVGVASAQTQTNWGKYLNTDLDASHYLQTIVDESAGLVELPAGTLHLEHAIQVDLARTGFRELRGSTATRIIKTTPGPAFEVIGSHFRSADPEGFAEQVWDRERMPTLIGFAIEGQHPEADGIEASGTMQLTLSNLHLRKLRHGVRLVNNNRNLLIDACHIYENGGCGIFYDNVNLHQSNIVGCHISYCQQGGIVARGGNVRNIHITGCDIESNMGADQDPTANILIDCRRSDYGIAEVAITGCTIQHNDAGPDSANIRMIGNSNATDDGRPRNEGHVTITGNVLSDVHNNVWLEGCRGITLTGNTFWMGYDYNLRLDNCSHIVMAANNFDRNPRYDYGHARDSRNLISVKDCEDCTLAGLHVSAISGENAAVEFSDCKRLNVSGLTILDCQFALKINSVSQSVFSGCLINSSSDEGNRIQIRNCQNNRWDEAFDIPLVGK